MALDVVSQSRCFDGTQFTYRHRSSETGTAMRFAAFIPRQADQGAVPVVWYLSGLTCTEENFTVKAGAQRIAAELGLLLVAPDTSPRGDGVPGDPAGSYDFGLGAGFYVDATQEPWSRNYRMASYVERELPALIKSELPADIARQSIMGHSMGGHGALTIALRNQDRYASVSAFSPICSPMNCPWGEKALSGYLGSNSEATILRNPSTNARSSFGSHQIRREELASARHKCAAIVRHGGGASRAITARPDGAMRFAYCALRALHEPKIMAGGAAIHPSGTETPGQLTSGLPDGGGRSHSVVQAMLPPVTLQ
jgi:S-formylglutathione hydrolase